MLDSMEYYYQNYNKTSDQSVITSSWNDLQISMKCCGVNEFQDWDQNPTLNMTSSVPDSCCKTLTENCGVGKLHNDDINDIYEKGCLINFFDVVNDNENGIVVAFILIFSAQIMVSVMACYLGFGLKKRKYRKIEDTKEQTNIDCMEEEQ